MIALGLVLILLIIFIAQNTDDVDVAFLGWEGRAPLSVTLLIAAAAGLFLAGIAGMLRILQLRRRRVAAAASPRLTESPTLHPTALPAGRTRPPGPPEPRGMAWRQSR